MGEGENVKKRDFAAILKAMDPRTRGIGLVLLITEALFVAAIFKLPQTQVIWAFVICGIILVVCITAIVIIERTRGSNAKTQGKGMASGQQATGKFTGVFEVVAAVDFYRQIAHKYDERNTAHLLRTHRTVIDAVENAIRGKTNPRVLDLGAGTGRLIAAQFYNRTDLHWTYLDNCPNMVEMFHQNLEGTPLNKTEIMDDIANAHTRLDGQQFDAIVMSFVLTSLENIPDMSLIVGMLRPGGSLIIADIDPSYTALNPYYSVRTNGETYALKPNPVNPLELCELLCGLNMRMVEGKPVPKQDGVNYSFCLVFSI